MNTKTNKSNGKEDSIPVWFSEIEELKKDMKTEEMKAAAEILYQQYGAFKTAGFTPRQAMQLVCTLIEVSFNRR